MKILKTIPSLVNSLQSNKVLQKIIKRKDAGEFLNEEEYNSALRQELINVASSDGESSFRLNKIKPGVAFSEYINNSIESISNDLDIAFSEINYLFSKISSHKTFFERNCLEIEALVNKLERKLEAVEIEAGLDSAYNKVVYNSFLDKSDRINFSHEFSNELFYDKREDERLVENQRCSIEPLTGYLSLPLFSNSNIDISEVSILPTQTTVSEFNVEIPGSNINNLRNNDSNSIWSYNVLLRKKNNSPVSLGINVDLGDKKEINKIEISPNAGVPMILESVKYINELGDEVFILSESSILLETKVFNFETIIAKHIHINLKQDMSTVIPLDLTGTSVTLDDLQRDPTLPVNIKTIESTVSGQINNPSIKKVLGLNTSQIENNILLNNYTFSLRGIKVGKSDYKTKGVYVSKEQRTNKPSIISLEEDSEILLIKDVQTGLDIPSGSIEYSILKKDYREDGLMIKNTEFNILPLGKNRINNEYLSFTTSKINTLRFIGHTTSGDGSNVKIFRNGIELVRGIDWRFSERVNQADSSDPIIAIDSYRTSIEIMHGQDQIKNGIYYAEYSPRYVLNPEVEISENGVKFLESGATVHPLVHFGEQISYSKVFIKIMIRNHSDFGVSSPLLNFYRLLIKEENND